MELYLRWLEKYEKEPGEETPLGLILCAEKASEHERPLGLLDELTKGKKPCKVRIVLGVINKG